MANTSTTVSVGYSTISFYFSRVLRVLAIGLKAIGIHW